MEAITTKSEINDYSVSELNYIRDSIENMTKSNQIDALRILYKNKNVILNENKYGIHVNLSELSRDVLDELSKYIKFVNAQEQSLTNFEKEKETYLANYFTDKDIKDKNTNISNI